MMSRQCLVAIPFIVSALINVGCATPQVWANARRESRTLLLVEGAVRADESSGEPACLIVRYDAYGVSTLFVKVPLDSAGLPPAALTYSDTARKPSTIGKELDPARLKTVEHYPLEPISDADLKSLQSAGRYEPFGQWFNFFYLPDRQVVAVAMRTDGKPYTVEELNGLDPTFPPECRRIFLLPKEQMRPASERHAAATSAVLLTPATVAVDAALLPVGFVMRLIRGD